MVVNSKMSSFRKIFLTGVLWKFLFYISAFILNAFIANKLGAADSGKFYYLLNNLSFVVLVLSLGFDSGINYYNGARQITRNQLFTLSTFFCVATCILFIVACYVLMRFSFVASGGLSTYIIWYVAGSLSFNVFAAFYYSENKHITPNLVLTVSNVLLIILLPGVISGNIISNLIFFRIYLSMNLLAAIWMIVLLFFRGARYERLRLKNILTTGFIKYSFQSFLLSALFALLVRCDYWIVAWFCNDKDVGNYLQTSKFVQLVMLVPSLASFSLFPLIVQSIVSENGIEFKLIRLVNIYIYASLLICISLAVTGKFLFPLIYGSTYNKMYMLFLLLIPGLVSMAATYPLAPFFSAKKLIPVNLKGMIVSIVVLVAAEVLLIPYYGVYGAAIGCSLGYCCYLFFLLYHFRKHISFSLLNLLNPKSFIAEIRLWNKNLEILK